METARKPPTLPLARKFDLTFGTGGTTDSFESEWRELRQGSLLEGFPQFIGYEGRAVEIRLYEVGVMPGLLQTPAYTTALARGAVRRGAITQEQAEERVALLAERQAALDRAQPPLITAVVDESCLRRPLGGPAVMEAQFTRLLDFAEQPNTALHLAPFTMGAARPFDLPVTLLTLPDRSVISYAESSHRGHLERESTFVWPLLTSYHQLQAEALSQAESVAVIKSLAKGQPS